MTLYGKGFYIWQIPNCEGGDPDAIARLAREAGLSHVLIKIADGPTWPYNFDFNRNLDLVPPVREALREVGVEVWGWHYVRGDDPINEARLAIERTLELEMEGYVIDAESEYQKKAKETAARRFMSELRAGLPSLPIALSTYRFPRVHRDFPFEAFLKKCDYSMPQVYYEQAHNPEEQLERCVEQYMDLSPARPVIPTLPAYTRGDWKPSAQETTRFLEKARAMGLTAVNAWSWDFARRENYLYLWDAVADFDWPVGETGVEDIPERLIGRMNQHDPSLVAGLYAENAAHVTGERTVVGREAVQVWYRTLLNEILPEAQFELTGKSGEGRSRHFMWRATSPRGIVTDGNDTLGVIDGRIQYHFTYFSLS